MIIHIKVKPNSKEEKIEKVAEGEYITNIKEPAKDNRANIKLVNLLAKEFNVSFNNIRIKNPNSRKKIVEILE